MCCCWGQSSKNLRTNQAQKILDCLWVSELAYLFVLLIYLLILCVLRFFSPHLNRQMVAQTHTRSLKYTNVNTLIAKSLDSFCSIVNMPTAYWCWWWWWWWKYGSGLSLKKTSFLFVLDFAKNRGERKCDNKLCDKRVTNGTELCCCCPRTNTHSIFVLYLLSLRIVFSLSIFCYLVFRFCPLIFCSSNWFDVKTTSKSSLLPYAFGIFIANSSFIIFSPLLYAHINIV